MFRQELERDVTLKTYRRQRNDWHSDRPTARRR